MQSNFKYCFIFYLYEYMKVPNVLYLVKSVKATLLGRLAYKKLSTICCTLVIIKPFNYIFTFLHFPRKKIILLIYIILLYIEIAFFILCLSDHILLSKSVLLKT